MRELRSLDPCGRCDWLVDQQTPQQPGPGARRPGPPRPEGGAGVPARGAALRRRLDEPEQVDMVLGDGARDRGAACELIPADPATGAGVAFVRLEDDPDPAAIVTHLVAQDFLLLVQESEEIRHMRVMTASQASA